MHHQALVIASFVACSLWLAAGEGPGCEGRGSELHPARWEDGLPLRCPYAPDAPGFRLFTPAHRAVVARAGFRLGPAHLRTQWIVRYRCTGLWFLPVMVSEVRAYGVVLDVEAERCA